MAYTLSKANLAQTAYNVASTVTGALVGAGLISSTEDAFDCFRSTQAEVFEELSKLQDSEPKSEPRSSGGRRYNNAGGGDSKDAGSIVLSDKFKKHANKTIAQVYAEDPSYVVWMAEKGRNAYMAGKAKAFLASVNHRDEDAGGDTPGYF